MDFLTKRSLNNKQLTEKALDLLHKRNHLVDPLVYVPASFRGPARTRIRVDDLRITLEPHDLLDNAKRIREADPIGFLIAAMNGQPVPKFKILRADGVIELEYETYSLEDRVRVAAFLASKITHQAINKNDKHSGKAYDTMIEEALNKSGLQETSEEE